MKIIERLLNRKSAEEKRETDSSDDSRAVFAGGCFWCVEAAFLDIEGVVNVYPGYTGGDTNAPTYEMVCGGRTGHYEAVEIIYDSALISYKELLSIYWRQIDPTDPDGQFADRGSHYRTAVFYVTDEQRRLAEESKRELEKSGRFSAPAATLILPAGKFYRAEEYHHRYCKTHPARYEAYKKGSGRAAFIDKTWGDKDARSREARTDKQIKNYSVNQLKNRLTPVQYNVAVKGGTEPPFRNEYWDNKTPGLYVDIISGEPLFISKDKFDSGTGWPSFRKPVSPGAVKTDTDNSHGMRRVEVLSAGGSHLGHLFDDGPAPEGNRYCINSASLRFVKADDLEKEGYGDYAVYFRD